MQGYSVDQQAPVLAFNIADGVGERILLGDFTPGGRLSEAEVARAYSVSHSPVREAFQLLTERGLVEAIPRKGIRVIAPDRPDAIRAVGVIRSLFTALAQRSGPPAGPAEALEAALEEVQLLGTTSPFSAPRFLDAARQLAGAVFDHRGHPLGRMMLDRTWPSYQLFATAELDPADVPRQIEGLTALARMAREPRFTMDPDILSQILPLAGGFDPLAAIPQTPSRLPTGSRPGTVASTEGAPPDLAAFLTEVDRHVLTAAISQPTLAQFIAEHVRRRIQHGDYVDGQRLTEEDLSEEFHCSRGPIRDAFRILDTHGLVDVRMRKGACVRYPSEDELHQLYDIRAELFADAMADAAAAIRVQGPDAAWFDFFRRGIELMHLLTQMPDVSTLALVELRRCLSKITTFGTGNRILAKAASEVDQRVVPVNIRLSSPERRQEAARNWALIGAAVGAGDQVEARRLARDMVRDAKAKVLASKMAVAAR
ncbi:MAG: GntR family transcriptional regulator [Alphaproteobacteria bacterium]|nr:GntR family transcriptional regulator [Alphaproteobacteria bacterium]